MRERAARLAVVLCALACAGRGLAAAAGAAAPAPSPLLRDIAVLVDSSGTETVASVAAAPPERWRPVPGILSAGFTRSVHWMRFTVDAPAGEWWLEVLPPFLDDLRLHEPDPAQPGAFSERRAGCLLPFSAREVAYRGFVFRVSRTDAVLRTFYLRLRTDHSSILFPRLWAPGEFLAAKNVVYGILFGNLGLLLVLLLVNVGAWLWLREEVHALLVAYLVGIIATLLGNEGFLSQYLLPSHPGFADALVVVATHASVSLGSLFYRYVLLPESRRGALRVLFQLGFWLPIAALGAVALGSPVEAARLSSAVVLGMAVVIVPLSFRQWRGGTPHKH